MLKHSKSADSRKLTTSKLKFSLSLLHASHFVTNLKEGSDSVKEVNWPGNRYAFLTHREAKRTFVSEKISTWF